VPIGTPIRAPNTMTAVALRSACFQAFGTGGAAATKSITSSSAATSRGDAACERHEDQRGAESGKSARSSRDEGDRADHKGGIEVEAGWDEAKRAHPRRTPPVFFVTSATILAATASIS